MKRKTGKWLMLVGISCWVQLLSFGQNNITRLEYFIDDDPGFGAGTTVSISPATVINNLSVNVNIAALPNGFHHIYFRSRNTNGWGQTNQSLFLKQQINTSQVNKLEYYLDNIPDPGFGNATNIPITTGETINDVVIPINTSGLSHGIHKVFVRSRDNNGNWSITNSWMFIKQSVNTSQVNQLEYYVDNITDPGFGKATAVNINPANSVNDVVIPINIANLGFGIHKLLVRSRDNNGSWSITNNWMFIKQAVNSSQVNQLEYYVDNISDPGFGKATAVNINPANSVNDVVIPINIANLNLGIHKLFVRSRDNNGSWSITNNWIFIKQQVNASQVAKLEYFIDNIVDPGFGKATSVSIPPTSSTDDVVIPIDISTLGTGIHKLYVRSFDNAGSWSITNKWIFVKTTVTGNVVKAEYFFNTDPGFGKGINIPVTQGNSINDILLTLNVAGLPVGANNFYMRSQNADGSWSLSNRWLFWNDSRSGLVDRIEYYYDTDPGFNNGIPVAINAVPFISDLLVPINMTGLTIGQHVVYLRSHSSRGWSLTNKDTFNVTVTSPTPFINVNSVTQKISCAWSTFRISFHATGTYNAGNHFRVQLSDKDGSFTNPIVIGDTATTRSSEVWCVLPSHLPEGSNYKVRVVSSNTLVTGISGVDALTIHDRPELGADTTAYIICQGETFNLVPLYNTAGYTIAAWNTNDPEHAPAATYKLIVENVYGCKDTANAFVKQDVAIWTGAVSKSWHTAGNWSNNHVPTEKTHVIIQGVVANQCEISATDGIAASVQVKSSGTIKLLNNYHLLISASCNPLPGGQ